MSARSRQPAVCNTLPKPSCSPAGNLPEKQRWQHDLEGKKKRGKKGEMSNSASSGLGSPPAKLKEQPAPFRQLQSPERATPGAAVWMRQDRLYAGWRVTSQEQAESVKKPFPRLPGQPDSLHGSSVARRLQQQGGKCRSRSRSQVPCNGAEKGRLRVFPHTSAWSFPAS